MSVAAQEAQGRRRRRIKVGAGAASGLESGHEFAGRLNQAEGEADRADRPFAPQNDRSWRIYP
jgi:hypothetical protein